MVGWMTGGGVLVCRVGAVSVRTMANARSHRAVLSTARDWAAGPEDLLVRARRWRYGLLVLHVALEVQRFSLVYYLSSPTDGIVRRAAGCCDCLPGSMYGRSLQAADNVGKKSTAVQRSTHLHFGLGRLHSYEVKQ
ncbi:hypothetical protein HDV57DRAFT_108659 [Trichoderma longibrachiatum]